MTERWGNSSGIESSEGPLRPDLKSRLDYDTDYNKKHKHLWVDVTGVASEKRGETRLKCEVCKVVKVLGRKPTVENTYD